MTNKYLSRKFLMAVIGGIVIVINAVLEANGYPAMDAEKVLAFAGIIVGYIATEGYVDGKTK